MKCVHRTIYIISVTLALVLHNSVFANTEYGGQSMVDPLKIVLVREPTIAFSEADPQIWHYTSKPNLKQARNEHRAFVETLKKHGVAVMYHDAVLPNLADAIYVHDPVLMTDQGAIILSMGKALRRGEEKGVARFLEKNNIPIAFSLHGSATAEGGDMLWLDNKTLLIGRSYRTNQAGIDQLRQFLESYGNTVLAYDLPVDQGKEACLHLQSLISLVSHDKAVIYRKLMPVALLEELERRQFTLIDVPEDEYLTMGPNILAIKPNLVLTIEGNEKTKKLLEKEGVEVLTYRGKEISLKAEGGATCLTRPILRA